METSLKIKELRKNKNVSASELAITLSVTQQTIYDYESGKSTPSPEKLKILSKYFNVSIDYILDNEPLLKTEYQNLDWKNRYETSRKINLILLKQLNEYQEIVKY